MSSLTEYLRAGLIKASKQEATDMYRFCLQMIVSDGHSVPSWQHDWKIGQTYSWHYVRIVEYRTAQMVKGIEELIMARNKTKGRQNAPQQDYSFVRCELSSEDKKAAKIWVEENTKELGSLLHDTMASDYKFTCSFSPDHDTFTACLVGKPDNVFNPHKTLTARHKDWVVASLTVLYKHHVMFKGTLWEDASNDEDDGWA